MKQQREHEFNLPKNVNEYRHVLEQYSSQESDLEWILMLRRHQPIKTIQKEINANPPNFYNKDYEKYRAKTETDNNIRKNKMKINLGTYKHIIKRPYLNSSMFNFETTLRTNSNLSRNWKSLNFSSKNNLFDTYLPPLLTQSKENLTKLGDFVSRPLIQIDTKVTVNGNEIRQRKFEPSTERTSRSPFEHFISNKYNDRYSIKNVNAIKHIMNSENSNINTLWEAKLREYQKSSK